MINKQLYENLELTQDRSGFIALFNKELLRFWKVSFQTIAAPVMNAMLYLLIFSHVLDTRSVYNDIPYSKFIIPGLIIMSIMQNAFANPSSSILQSKMSGNLIFILLTPLTNIEILFAYLFAAIVRGLLVGLFLFLTSLFISITPINNLLWILIFAILTCCIMGVLGIIAGLYVEKYDQLAAFQNFLIAPFTLLSGVFYTIDTLPNFWQYVSKFNPFFYMIDGFRYGFLLKSDINPFFSLLVTIMIFLCLLLFALKIMSSGYKLRY